MNLLRKLELPLVLLLLASGSAFLLKMWLPVFSFQTIFGVAFSRVYGYARARHGVNIPLALLALIFAALQVDAWETTFTCTVISLDQCIRRIAHMTVQYLRLQYSSGSRVRC